MTCAETFEATVLAQPSLVSYWPMNDPSGGAIDVFGGNDAAENPPGSSHGQPINDLGSYSFTYGVPGPFPDTPALTAIRFEGDFFSFLPHGTQLYVDLGLSGFPFAGPYTLIGFVYPEDLFGRAAWSVYDGAPTDQQSLSGGLTAETFAINNISGGFGVEGLDPTPTDAWTFTACTFDGVDTMALYTDGVFQGDETIVFTAPAGSLRFGCQGTGASGPSNYWQGRLAQFALFSEVLSAETIAELACLAPPAGVDLSRVMFRVA